MTCRTVVMIVEPPGDPEVDQREVAGLDLGEDLPEPALECRSVVDADDVSVLLVDFVEVHQAARIAARDR